VLVTDSPYSKISPILCDGGDGLVDLKLGPYREDNASKYCNMLNSGVSFGEGRWPSLQTRIDFGNELGSSAPSDDSRRASQMRSCMFSGDG
jgi:hypothetical protein